MILTVTLNPALDCFMTKRYSSVIQEKVAAGGKGINVTRALNCLGVDSIATGFLGGATGRRVSEELDKERIDHCFVDIAGETRRNMTVLNASGKQRREVNEGPEIKRGELTRFIEQYKNLLPKSAWVVLCGRNAHRQSDALYARLICIAQNDFNVPVTLDSSCEAYRQGLKAKPTMIKPNLQEAEQALGRRIKGEKQVIAALKDFRRLGIKIVIISDYLKGAYGYCGNQMVHALPMKVKVLHDVGCGDTLVAGFLSEFHETNDFKQSLRFSVAAAAANNMCLTPGAVTKKQVKKMFQQVVLRKL